MSIDFLLWVGACICFAIAAFFGGRVTWDGLVPLGLLFGSLTFVLG